jgi:arginyl-tRNA--protein-N-Asp/Glu arginylyltransferase
MIIHTLYQRINNWQREKPEYENHFLGLYLQFPQLNMFGQIYCPDTLQPEELDRYLEQGWFRMNQTIFTTNFLHFKTAFYSAIWLRIALKQYAPDKTQTRLMKLNAGFRVEIKPALITSEKEALYSKYKTGVSFEASTSLHALLYGKTTNDVFHTLEVNLYDQDQLIGCGYFDLGETSAAGITAFYDPDYKKYSLGKYLIYLKLKYCKQRGLQYFYPGYFVPGYSYFDYKLEIGKPALEFLQLTSQRWLSINAFTTEDIPLKVMEDKLKLLQLKLQQSKIESQILKYDFFEVNIYPDLVGLELFDFPILLYFSFSNDPLDPFIVYDVRDQHYHLIKCRSVWPQNPPEAISQFYSYHIIKMEQDLFATPHAEELVAALSIERTINNI